MGFPGQEYWNGLPFPSPGDLSDPEITPRSPALQADSSPTELPGNYKVPREGLRSSGALLLSGPGEKPALLFQVKVTQSCSTLCDPMNHTVHGTFPGQNTGVGCLSLLQGIFPNQGSNPDLSH